MGLDFDHSNPDFSLDDEFPHRVVAYAVNHVLRELKHHARIPVPESWTLVGIADIHNVLEEGQVFACVQPHHSNKRIYLEGAVLITRSPVVCSEFRFLLLSCLLEHALRFTPATCRCSLLSADLLPGRSMTWSLSRTQ